jgi:site-specific recombinase XerD
VAVLTLDNLLLSRPKNDAENPSDALSVSCTRAAPETVADYVRESLARNTRTAYLSDLSHFESWGGRIPVTPETIASYLVAHADALGVATLRRRLAALAKVHRSKGMENPTGSELVKSTLRGLRRIKGTAQRQATPLIKDDLFLVLEATCGSRLKDVRDRALLLVGFAGGFRRSELVGLTVHDVEPVRQGMIITLQHSKTDQDGAGRKIGIPNGRGRWCPVAALEEWLMVSGTVEGSIFRKIAKPLSGEAVGLIVRERLRAAGIDPEGYSGHSLRAGLATSAAQAGSVENSSADRPRV